MTSDWILAAPGLLLPEQYVTPEQVFGECIRTDAPGWALLAYRRRYPHLDLTQIIAAAQEYGLLPPALSLWDCELSGPDWSYPAVAVGQLPASNTVRVEHPADLPALYGTGGAQNIYDFYRHRPWL